MSYRLLMLVAALSTASCLSLGWEDSEPDGPAALTIMNNLEGDTTVRVTWWQDQEPPRMDEDFRAELITEQRLEAGRVLGVNRFWPDFDSPEVAIIAIEVEGDSTRYQTEVASDSVRVEAIISEDGVFFDLIER